MQDWDDLVSVALVGTERRAAPDSVVTREAFAALTDRSAEAEVLAGAAVLGAYRRAGWVAGPADAPAPEPAPVDPRPACSPAAAQVLGLLLRGDVTLPGGSGELVAEWLRLAAAAPVAVPASLLVPVLEAATLDAPLRGPVRDAIGPRGLWLAARNPAWQWASPLERSRAEPRSDVADAWSTATRAERLTMIDALRRDDRAAAQELLATTWAGAPAAERAALVKALAPDVRDDDEAFLEAALDDRAGSVREAATATLDFLPGSRRAHRMAERLAPLVSVQGRLRRRLVIEPPPAPDDAARRDGVDTGASLVAGGGRRDAELARMIGATPLRFWTEQLGLAPVDVARLAQEHPAVIGGLVHAVTCQRHAEFAMALFDVRPGAAVLEAVPAPWDTRFSDAVLERMQAHEPNAYWFSAVVTVAATRLDPATRPAVERWFDALGDDDPRRRELRRLLHALTLRRTIAEELR